MSTVQNKALNSPEKIAKLQENRLSQSKFRCQVCGYTANADVNGARNILAAGHAVLACGEMVQSGRPLKQEPTEMIQATA
ncbi:cytosine methyltransferase [Escherichia coli]|nr:cytosine methyltransferase [Escherichia coli]MWU28301.1 transposase [Escherichia coli]